MIMKKKIFIGIGVVFLLFVIWVVYGLFIATPVSPPTTASYNEGGLEITVDYSQPSKKGRLIFGEKEDGALQPYGKYWRLGANAATEITFNKDVIFGGEPIKAGTYRMYAVPGPNAFKVTLNSETEVFFGVADPDHDLDISILQKVEESGLRKESKLLNFMANSFIRYFNHLSAVLGTMRKFDLLKVSVDSETHVVVLRLVARKIKQLATNATYHGGTRSLLEGHNMHGLHQVHLCHSGHRRSSGVEDGDEDQRPTGGRTGVAHLGHGEEAGDHVRQARGTDHQGHRQQEHVQR